MHPKNMTRIVGRTKYSTETATLLASDEYWDGSNWERHGRNQFLYRTPGGSYFEVNLTQWQGERDTLTPLSQDEAIALYESLQEQIVPFEQAFPGVEVKEG
ncbi:MAG: hypothetical protein ACOYYU_10325 [Chloroflexota bacterium]